MCRVEQCQCSCREVSERECAELNSVREGVCRVEQCQCSCRELLERECAELSANIIRESKRGLQRCPVDVKRAWLKCRIFKGKKMIWKAVRAKKH